MHMLFFRRSEVKKREGGTAHHNENKVLIVYFSGNELNRVHNTLAIFVGLHMHQHELVIMAQGCQCDNHSCVPRAIENSPVRPWAVANQFRPICFNLWLFYFIFARHCSIPKWTAWPSQKLTDSLCVFWKVDPKVKQFLIVELWRKSLFKNNYGHIVEILNISFQEF